MKHYTHALSLLVALASPALAQPWETTCLPGNDAGNGLQLAVDDWGRVHVARVARVGGQIIYTVVAPDGSSDDAVVGPRISRLGVDEVVDLGLLVTGDGTTARVCYPDRRNPGLGVATFAGDWSTERIFDGDVDGCDLAQYEGRVALAWHGDGALWAGLQEPGGWQTAPVDLVIGADVGAQPDIAVGPDGAIAVAHRDVGAGRLRVTWRDGLLWKSETAPGPGNEIGYAPAAAYDEQGQLYVVHGGVPSNPDVEADVGLYLNHGDPEDGLAWSTLVDDAFGGSNDAAYRPDGLWVLTRERFRSALFGPSDGLHLIRDAANGAAREQLGFAGAAQQRRSFRFVRLAFDPFGSPVVAFLEERPPFGNDPGGAPVCLMRAPDADADAVPDAVEATLGTDPNRADTDGDGRTDGEEILRDGTDPLEGVACQPAPETCDGVDQDCDGRADEGADAPCYPGPAETRNVGRCAEGVRACVDGELGACAGARLPGVERCNGVDDDCDGRTDEGNQRCGVGACEVQVPRCDGDAPRACVPSAAAPADTVCDGLDEDCDGATDEDFEERATACGVGACRAVGRARCVDGEASDDCRPGAPSADDDCDGVDDDCDGRADEHAPTEEIACGAGACAARGQRRCIDGAMVDDCRPGRPVADDVCDGVDQDCDGRADEGVIDTPTACGLGQCAAIGKLGCVEGEMVDDCRPGRPAADDTCDGVDQDCDGALDEHVAAADDVTCDGVDDDCDGRADEDAPVRATRCGAGVCAGEGVERCVDGEMVDDCRAGQGGADDTCDGVDDDCDGRVDEGVPASADDTCDGVDDDCDGRVDEGVAPAATRCGAGACAAEGVARCVDGEMVDDCRAGQGGADDTCDGVDDDCDGRVDEGVAPAATRCGAGACAAEGVARCVDGEMVDDCRAGQGGADDTCDGVDDDCDGRVDEGVAPAATRCGAGACAAEGVARCVDGEMVDDCRAGAATPDDTCDGVDDDCDGRVDEGVAPAATRCGAGACAAEGVARCVDGEMVDDCRAGAATPDDTCDGVDDDCDGRVDEAAAPRPVRCGQGACAAEGVARCVAGAWEETCEPGEPPAADDALCDGIDADCDGETDEDYLSNRTRCGVGACAVEGRRRCVDGRTVNDCVPPPPAADDASCDGVDDDCDGLVDEDCDQRGDDRCDVISAPTSDILCDGLDEDCDGVVDEDADCR